jgi:hypothetical protein
MGTQTYHFAEILGMFGHFWSFPEMFEQEFSVPLWLCCPTEHW